MLKKIFWFVIAAIGAGATGIVIGVINPSEKVNALWLLVAAACIFVIGYRFYSSFIAAKVLALDDKNITPAKRLNDGMDYHPTNRYVLFGHHFAAIAGAGPLIGPMLAAQFGYLPGFLWILIGAVVAGAVHDMVVLSASVRHDGRSVAQIAKRELGPVSGLAASLAILFIIIVTLAGFGVAVANALAECPWGTFTISLTIPIALFMGAYLYKIRIGHVWEMTAIGVTLLLLAVWLGHFVPGSPVLEPIFAMERTNLVLCIAIYGFIASVLPVWMLLCPRDYLSTYMKIGTIMLLAVAVVVIAPELEMPAVTKFAHGGGPIIPGTLFPFMFITIACGAVSGFHALVASGTTPKMISSEADIRMIGFGAMLAEGFVAMMALIAATILIPGDYFAINSLLPFDTLAALGFAPERINELSQLVGINVAHRPGGAVSLAVGMASILSRFPGLDRFLPYLYNFALMFEALFILTAIDTGTRVARFIVQEFGSYFYKPLNRQGWLPGILGTSLFVVAAWGYLIHSGNISTIWPMFGVANQLLAAIALGIGTTMIIKSGKLKYVWVTAAPMLFMVVTTLTAAVESIQDFWSKAGLAATPAEAFNLKLDAVLVFIMGVLTVVVVVDMVRKWAGLVFVRAGVVGAMLLLSFTSFAQEGRICLNNYHTGEILDVAYKVKGKYDEKAIAQIKNVFRSRSDNKEIDVDIKLIELLDDVQHHFDADCLELISGYRSPELNRQLKSHGANVAEESMHLEGKAADIHIDEATEEGVAEYARSKKLGGVGYYPAWDFVHIDTGELRNWNLPDRPGRLLMAFKKSDKWQVMTDKDVYLPGEGIDIQIMNITRTKKAFADKLILQSFSRGKWSDVRTIEICGGSSLAGGGICEAKFTPDKTDKLGKYRLTIPASKEFSHMSAMSNEFYLKQE